MVDTLERRGSARSVDDDFLSDIPTTQYDLDSHVLAAVRRDPFATITEIRREISRDPHAPVAGWWQVWGVLRRHRLLTRHARFRYVRGRW